MAIQPVCLINVVGLTPAHLGPSTPNLSAYAAAGTMRPLTGVVPAVTCSAQATMLTGEAPSGHGVVGNGWLYRDTMEVRFWQQSNRLLQREPFYVTAARRAADRGQDFSSAKLFWWFNQGAHVDRSLTPKPWYGSDGSKVFGVHGTPPGWSRAAERDLGAFPFHTFWGPMAGLPCSDWIASAAAWTLREHHPSLALVYLPHLDYDLQRHGASGDMVLARLREIDACVGVVLDACRETGTTPVIVSEYGIEDVDRAVPLNQLLRQRSLLEVRDGPFGETLDTFNSRAFAVVDHQLAHIYVGNEGDVDRVAEFVQSIDGVDQVQTGSDRSVWGLDHARTGEVVAMASKGSWFAYPYWLDERRAPDFARTVDIHRKPGYDPCELVFDPHIPIPKMRAGIRLAQKKLGFRMRMDVVGLDTSVVGGSHGRVPDDPASGPLVVGPGKPPSSMEQVRDYVLELLGLA